VARKGFRTLLSDKISNAQLALNIMQRLEEHFNKPKEMVAQQDNKSEN
jgi:hypothetical protein